MNDQPEIQREYWGNETLKRKSHYKNRKLDGLATIWYQDGGRWEYNYKDGKKEGPGIFWCKNGKKEIEIHYKNGIEHGLRTEWDQNGNMTYEKNFVDGVEEVNESNEEITHIP